ncbi:Multidrug resistance protein MdtA [subsurface metagenome]
MVGPTQPLVSIVDIDTVKLLTHVSDEDIDLVKLTQRVGVKVDTYLDKVFEVKEINISPVMDPLSRKIEVAIKVSNPDYLMKPGMFPRVRLLVQRDNALLVPQSALVEKDGQKEVFVVRNGTVHLRKVRAGLETDDLVEVLSGLDEGDLVVVAGPSDLKDGDKVRIQEGDEE